MSNTSPFRVVLVRMKFPDNLSGQIAISNHTLEADAEGWVEVPPQLVEQCQSHGFKTEAQLREEARQLGLLAAQATQGAGQPQRPPAGRR